MAKKTWNNPIDKNVDWGGDASTENLPVSGEMVQKFIKDSLNGKAGIFYYDTANNRYIVFADASTRDEYLDDPTRTDLIIGTFDAPFNYTAEINLATPTYNAVYLGDAGNYLDFTFDVKNKQGASTGENVVITYTFIRNASKEVHSQVARHGESIHFNVDKYLGEGSNTIIIGVTGQTSLAATTVSVTYNVVNLQLTDETDISIVYDLSSGPKVMEVPFTIKGTGTKVVEWYLDGEFIEFVKNEDEVVDIEAQRVKYIQLANLQQGKHSLQIRAYTTINGERFYTQTLYRDIMIYTGANSNSIMAISMEIPAKYGLVENTPIIYGITQYIPYPLKFATYSPGNKTINVTVSVDTENVGSVNSQNGIVNEFSIVSNTSGNKTIYLAGDEFSYEIPAVVAKTTMSIEEITSNLKIDFSAIGKNNNSSDKDLWQQGDYYGTFEGFEWNAGSGWANNRLKINAGASFGINYAPLADNPKALGRTLEFEFKTLNVNDDNAVICDLRNPAGVGILITATKVSVTSENGVVVENEFKSNENVRISIVINRATGTTRKGLTLIYANGSISRGVNWAVDDNYTSDANILFKGSAGAEVELKSIRIYESALSDDNILNNYILYRDSVAEMLEVYDRNDVYAEGTTIFSPDKMVSRLPVMIVTGDIPTLENTSDKDTQIIVDIEYTNMQDTSRSFKMVGAAMRPQGTSSMGYPKKNFRIYTQKVANTILYDSNGKIVSDKLYSFKEGAIPVDCWCLKADYAESSGTHNTGIARMWNNALYNMQIDGQYVCRTEAQKAAIAAGYPYDVRTTIDGFPILLFYRKNATDEPIFIGKYNFNNDKSTEKVFGFTDIPGFDNSRMQCWEILNNGNPLALFQTIDGFDDGWKEAYESRYPDTKTPNTDDLKAFSQWMVGVNGDHERFATEKWEHFKIYPMAAYYCYLMRHAAADQLVKNAMFTSEDGVKFYFIQYDNDTINGLINTGDIDILPTDDRQSVDESGEYKFAGHGSVLWNMLEADTEFMEIVRTVDNALYSAGVSYNECVKIFDEEQADKWVERVYNQDSEYKYVGPYVNQGINNLFMLQGKRDLHRRWWLSKRFSIYDAKFVSGEYKSQAIELKCMNDTPAGQRFSIKAGYPLDYGFGINNLPRESGVTLAVGESHTFETTEVVNLGDPIRIYGAPNIEEVDLSPMANRLAVVTIANVYSEALGTRLKKLILGGENVNNLEVPEISGLKQAKMLTHLDVRGMRGIKALDLTSQPYFEELKAIGSEVASVSFAKGAPVNRLELPATMKTLTLEQLPNLTSDNIIFDDIAEVNSMSIRYCPLISQDFNFVYNWYKLKTTEDSKCSLIMDNIIWNNVDPAKISELVNIKKSGGTLDLKGVVNLTTITEEQVTIIRDNFGDSAFDKNSNFYFTAPDSVFLVGPNEVLEGETLNFNSVVFSNDTITENIYSVITTGYSNISFVDGKFSTEEIDSSADYDITVRFAVVTNKGNYIFTEKTITVIHRVYPTNIAYVDLKGPNTLNNEYSEYIWVPQDANVNGDVLAVWELTGDALNYVTIYEQTNKKLTLKRNSEYVETAVTGVIKLTLFKKFNNSQISGTKSLTINIVNDSILMTSISNPYIFYCLKQAGLTTTDTYLTKEDAAKITADQLQPGTSSNTSIFYSRGSSIQSFDEFEYFTGVTTLKPYTLCNWSNCTSIKFPKYLTSIGNYNLYYFSYLESVEFPTACTIFGDYVLYECYRCSSLKWNYKQITQIGKYFGYEFNQRGTSLISIDMPRINNWIDNGSLNVPIVHFSEARIGKYNFTGEGYSIIPKASAYSPTPVYNIPQGVSILPVIGPSISSNIILNPKFNILESDGTRNTYISDNYIFSKGVHKNGNYECVYLVRVLDGTDIVKNIPTTIEGLPVVLGEGCFAATNLKEVEISLKSFDGAWERKGLFALSSIEKVTVELFDDTSGRRELKNLFSNTTLGEVHISGWEYFQEAESIFSYSNYYISPEYLISQGVNRIPKGAYIGNSGVPSELLIPEGMTLGEYAFQNCPQIEKLIFNSEKIPAGGFSGIQSTPSVLKEVTGKFTYIDEYAFDYCDSLETVSSTAEIVTIRSWKCFGAASNFPPLKTLNAKVHIEKYGYKTLSYLEELHLAPGTIPYLVGLTGLKRLYIEDPLPFDYNNRGTIATENLFGKGTSSSPYVGRKFYNTGENTLYLPSNATGFDESVWEVLLDSSKCGFKISKTLPEVAIAETDKGILLALKNKGLCKSSAYISVDEAKVIQNSDLEHSTSSGAYKSIFYNYRNSIKSFNGFKYFTGISEVPYYMLSECTGLTSIELPDTLQEIPGAMLYKTAITELTIPEGVTSIYGLNSCLALKKINILRNEAPTIASMTFGTSTSTYTGRNTYNTGENMLYVPAGATGYDTGYWLDPLQNAEKCGFTLSATL